MSSQVEWHRAPLSAAWPAEALALLALVAGQDIEPAEDSDGTDGRWQIARRVAEDRVISTVDPDARHAHKTVHGRTDGFTAHVLVEPDTGLITGSALTKAGGADASEATVGIGLLADDDTIGGPVQVRGDSAYGTAQALAALDRAGHTAVIKTSPAAPAWSASGTAWRRSAAASVSTARAVRGPPCVWSSRSPPRTATAPPARPRLRDFPHSRAGTERRPGRHVRPNGRNVPSRR